MKPRGPAPLAALLVLSGCMRSCFGGLTPVPADPEPAPEEAQTAAPGPTAPAPSGRCSFEESQRLTSLLERERAAELREIADRAGWAELSMVPLRLQYDGAGQVEAAQMRIPANGSFSRDLDAAAKRWRLDGVHQAAVCDLAVQVPRSDEPPDAGPPRRPPPSMKAPLPPPAEE